MDTLFYSNLPSAITAINTVMYFEENWSTSHSISAKIWSKQKFKMCKLSTETEANEIEENKFDMKLALRKKWNQNRCLTCYIKSCLHLCMCCFYIPSKWLAKKNFMKTYQYFEWFLHKTLKKVTRLCCRYCTLSWMCVCSVCATQIHQWFWNFIWKTPNFFLVKGYTYRTFNTDLLLVIWKAH